MTGWENFFIAQAGAAAALTGLIFVAVSINLNRILAVPYLPDRALQSLILLSNILIVSSLMLVPGQSLTLIAIELLGLTVILWGVTFKLALSILRLAPAEYRKPNKTSFILTQVAVLPFFAAGICILLFGRWGIYFLVPGVFISFYKALLDAWVLLIEINR